MTRLFRWSDGRPVAALLAVAVVAVGLWKGTWVAGGADSYGYVSQAALLADGRLMQPSPWILDAPWPGARHSFASLGYNPHDDLPAIVPIYSIGLPLLMAAAQIVGGPCAVFWVVPLTGGLVVLLTWNLGVRLGSAPVGLLAAFLVATSPAFVFMLLQPMSDVPVTAAWALVFWAMLARTRGGALVGGVAAAFAVLIRPNLAPILAVVAAWLIVDVWRTAPDRRPAALMRAIAIVGLGLAGGAAVAWVNWELRGSPLKSGYGDLSELYTWANVSANTRLYFQWFVETQSIVALAGLAAVFMPSRRLWPTEARAVVPVFAALALFLALQYSTYFVFDSWTYLRFLLPLWPFVMIGLVNAVRAATVRAPRAVRGGAMAALVLLALWGVSTARARSVFDSQKAESKYPRVGQLTRQMTEPGSVVLSHQHSGSLRYYAGRMTIHYERLDSEWLDRAAAWLAAEGAHPYALLEDWEVEAFRAKFQDANVLGRLAMTPSFVYDGGARVFLFDLLRSEDDVRRPIVIQERFEHLGCVRPEPTPTLGTHARGGR